MHVFIFVSVFAKLVAYVLSVYTKWFGLVSLLSRLIVVIIIISYTI